MSPSVPPETPSPSPHFLKDVAADAAVWARAWNQALTLPVMLRLIFLEPGFQAALLFRIQTLCGHIPIIGKPMRRLLWYIGTVLHGTDIAPSCAIGAGVWFPHPQGIVIGGHVRIGAHAKILQRVTIGRHTQSDAASPIVHDHVTIYAGACVFGAIDVGAHAVIGANAVVFCDVPAHHRAVGVPARILPPPTPGPSA